MSKDEYNKLANELLNNYLEYYARLNWFKNDNKINLNEDQKKIKEILIDKMECKISSTSELNKYLLEEKLQENLGDKFQKIAKNTKYKKIKEGDSVANEYISVDNDIIELCTTYNIGIKNDVAGEFFMGAYWNLDYANDYLRVFYKIFVNMEFKDCKYNLKLERTEKDFGNNMGALGGKKVMEHFVRHFSLFNLNELVEDTEENEKYINFDDHDSFCENNHHDDVNKKCIDTMEEICGNEFKIAKQTKVYKYNEILLKKFFDDFEVALQDNDYIEKIIYKTNCSCNRCHALERIFRTTKYIHYLTSDYPFIDW